MTRSIEVLFSPVEFSALSQRNLGRTACVVLDILRAPELSIEGPRPAQLQRDALTAQRAVTALGSKCDSAGRHAFKDVPGRH